VLSECSAHARALVHFPTRRSSDLLVGLAGQGGDDGDHLTAGADVAVDFAGDGGGLRGVSQDGGAELEHHHFGGGDGGGSERSDRDRKSTRLNSSHVKNSYAVFCLK